MDTPPSSMSESATPPSPKPKSSSRRSSKRTPVPLLLDAFPSPPTHIPSAPISTVIPPTPLPITSEDATSMPAMTSNPPPTKPPSMPLPPIPGPSPITDQGVLLAASRSRSSSKVSIASSSLSAYSSPRNSGYLSDSTSITSISGPIKPESSTASPSINAASNTTTIPLARRRRGSVASVRSVSSTSSLRAHPPVVRPPLPGLKAPSTSSSTSPSIDYPISEEDPSELLDTGSREATISPQSTTALVVAAGLSLPLPSIPANDWRHHHEPETSQLPDAAFVDAVASSSSAAASAIAPDTIFSVASMSLHEQDVNVLMDNSVPPLKRRGPTNASSPGQSQWQADQETSIIAESIDMDLSDLPEDDDTVNQHGDVSATFVSSGNIGRPAAAAAASGYWDVSSILPAISGASMPDPRASIENNGIAEQEAAAYAEALSVHLRMRASRSTSESLRRELRSRTSSPTGNARADSPDILPIPDLLPSTSTSSSLSSSSSAMLASSSMSANMSANTALPNNRSRESTASAPLKGAASLSNLDSSAIRADSPDIDTIVARTSSRPRSTAQSSSASSVRSRPSSVKSTSRPRTPRSAATSRSSSRASESIRRSVLPYLHDEDEDEEPLHRGRPSARAVDTALADGGNSGNALLTAGEDWNDESFISDYGEVIRRPGGARGFELDEGEVIAEEVEEKAEDSDSDSSIDLHTPLPNLMLKHGHLSVHSKLLQQAVSTSENGRPMSTLSLGSSTGSIVTKSGIYRDERDTPRRRTRHRDGNMLRGGLGLTTGLGWSDSEDEGAPSPLTRRISHLNLSRKNSLASTRKSSISSMRSDSSSHPLSRSFSSDILYHTYSGETVHSSNTLRLSNISSRSSNRLPGRSSLDNVGRLQSSHGMSRSSSGRASLGTNSSRYGATPNSSPMPPPWQGRASSSSDLTDVPHTISSASNSTTSLPLPMTPHEDVHPSPLKRLDQEKQLPPLPSLLRKPSSKSSLRSVTSPVAHPPLPTPRRSSNISSLPILSPESPSLPRPLRLASGQASAIARPGGSSVATPRTRVVSNPAKPSILRRPSADVSALPTPSSGSVTPQAKPRTGAGMVYHRPGSLGSATRQRRTVLSSGATTPPNTAPPIATKSFVS